MNNQKPHKHSRNISGHRNKTSNSISFLKHPFNIFTKNNNNKTINCTDKKISFYQIIKSNLQIYNITNQEIDIIKINDLIDTKNCHLVAIFKDYLISDYIEEFLRRFYKNKESKLRIPKFSDYYKNYLTFFCNPIFSDFFANKVIQNYGEAKAEIYYKKNYGNKNKESKHKHKHKHNKEIAKTIFNTLINESIEYVIKDTKEFISTINTQETMNLKDETILEINGQNKNSNNNSIISLLKCFSVKEKKSKNKIQNLNIKKIKKYDINNSNKYTIDKDKNNKNSPNKSNNNKNKNTSTIPTSARNYTNNRVNLKNTHQKNLKRIETSTSNNLSSNRTKNKSKSKDFSNSKGHQMASTMSNSNFSRNHIKIPINNKNVGIYLNNKIYLTSNSPIYSQRIRMKKSSKGKRINDNNNTTKIKSKKKNHLKKNSENIDLKDIMKLTLQAYDYKTRNKSNNTLNNNIKHFHTLSSPTINNFNININNHICLNNNNLNSKKNKKSSFQGKKNINSRNKEQNLFKTNTDLEQNKNKNHSPNFHSYATNTTNDLESIIKNKFFSSLNGSGNDKLIKDINGLKSNRLFHHNLKIKNIYDNKKVLSPKIKISPKGFFVNKNLKNHMNSKKKENKISPPKNHKI